MEGTTTISTIAVQSGSTRIVIALLQVSEWLELRVLDVTPELTHLGQNLKEAEELRKSHHDLINKIQAKKSPVEELVDQAEAVISRQGTSPRVYSAMTHSLSTVWENVNSHLELRARILDFNLNYHRWAEDFEDCCRRSEDLCETEVPIDINEMQDMLQAVRDSQREALNKLARTLAAGAELLQMIQSLRNSATLDSRPDHIKLQVALAQAQVEGWMERLHDRRKSLQLKVTTAISRLEECLELALLTTGLTRLQREISEGVDRVSRVEDHLGDTSASATLLLHENNKLLPTAKELQDEALKIVRSSEEFWRRGHFASQQATAQSYLVLEEAADYVASIDRRSEALERAVHFFTAAEQALVKLDQLEVRLSTGDLGLREEQLRSLHSEVSSAVEQATSEVIQEGYQILSDIPTAEGVKRMVEQIENKKINLNVQCVAHKEEHIRTNAAYNNFMEKFNLLNSFLNSMEAYLSGVTTMGSDLSSAKEFLQIYKRNLNDLLSKGPELKAVLRTARDIGTSSQREEQILTSCGQLEKRWTNMVETLEARVNLATSYVKVLTLIFDLSEQLDIAEKIMWSGGNDAEGEQALATARQLKQQLENKTTNFVHDSYRETGLQTEAGRQCVETGCSELRSRLCSVEESWTLYLGRRKEAQVKSKHLWETTMADSNKTVDWVSKLYDQLYPVLTPELHSPSQLSLHVEQKLNTVLPEIRRALGEIQLRQETAQALLNRSEFYGTNEGIAERLRDLSTRLNAISADYQVLLEKMLTFFNNLSQIETRVERAQREEMTSSLEGAREFGAVESLRRTLEADRRTVGGMFDLCHAESTLLVGRIKAQEGPKCESDIRTVETCLDSLRYSWQRLLTSRDSRVTGLERRSTFDTNLREIERSLEGLVSRLLASRGYGESLPEANAALQAFESFQSTIQLLETKISEFVSNGQELIGKEGGEEIERDIAGIKRHWTEIQEQVKKTRSQIGLTIQLFTLVQQAEDWFRDGNRLLTSIVHRSTFAKTQSDVIPLIKELEAFFQPGEKIQNDRIAEICRLADQLYGGDIEPRQLSQVKTENREMFESFSQINKELKAISDRMKPISPTPIVHLMDVDCSSKVEQDLFTRTIIREFTSTTFESTRRDQLTPSPGLRIEEVRLKTPSPPPKKVKIQDERIPPSFDIQLRDIVVQEGSHFVFKSKVSGRPEPEVRWEKDGLTLVNSPHFLAKDTDEGEHILVVEEAALEDGGRYSCVATSPAGSAITTASLSVRAEEKVTPPIFLIPLLSATVQEGQPLRLKCHITGTPLPTVQWYRGYTCLDSDPLYQITYNNGEALLTKTQTTSQDSGEFCCEASNIAGTKKSIAQVNIKQKQLAPKLISGLRDVKCSVKETTRLDCEVVGATKLVWSHDGKPLKQTDTIKVVKDGNKSSLILSEATPQDAGVYTLTASNTGGSIVSTGTLLVTAETKVTDMKPQIQLQLKDQSVFEGKKVRFDCIIVGHPEPEVIWYHNNVPVKESPEIHLMFEGDCCSMVIEQALCEDAGRYRVVAINTAGEASSDCSLNITPVDKKIETKPSAAESPSASEGRPIFLRLLLDRLVKVGDEVCLECSVGGSPLPTVTWSLNNVELQQSPRIHMSQDAEGLCLLKIKEAVAEDRGVYTARAVNQLGEAKCFCHLIVKCPLTLSQLESGTAAQPAAPEERPAFTELFSDLSVPAGSTAKFECIVTGKPTPKVKWLYNGEVVTGRDFLVSTSGPRQVLTIPEAKSPMSGASVSCTAENSQGRASCVAKLTVREGPGLSEIIDSALSSKDGVFEMKKSVFVESSSSSHFSTFSSADSVQPKVEVKSFTSKSEAASHKIGDKPPVSIETHQTTEYRNIDGLETKGETSVIQSSGLDKSSGLLEGGLEKSKSGSGLVLSKRRNTPPRFISPLNGCIVDQGAPVTLVAIIEGHPTPELNWTKNGGPVPGDAQLSWSIGKATLRLPSVTTAHGGRYSLTANNCAGSATSSADVVVKKSSFPPVLGRRVQSKTPLVGERLHLEIEVTGTPMPTVKWSKDGRPINAATIGYRLESQGDSHSLIVNKVNHSHSGQYCATATNSAGEASSMAEVRVLDPPPPQQPSTDLSSSLFHDLMSGNTSVFNKVEPGQTITTTFKKPGESVVVEESFQRQKHVSMKVSHHEESYGGSLLDTKDLLKMEAPKKFESIRPVEEVKKSEKVETFEQFQKVEEPKNEDLITDSISTKSSLDFFKNIIKENETVDTKKPKCEPFKLSTSATEDSKKFETKFDSFEFLKPTEETKKIEPKFEPFKYSKPVAEEPKKFEPLRFSQPLREESKKEFESFSSSSFSCFEEKESLGNGFILQPEPPPEMGFMPKTAGPKGKDEMIVKVKKLEESSRNLKDIEAPSGGVRILPLPKKTEDEIWDERKELREELFSSEKYISGFDEKTHLRAAADVAVRPSSPRPSAEGVAMERLWTTKLEHKPALERPKTPQPSEEGKAMDKLWGHKHSESHLNTVWPPPSTEETSHIIQETEVQESKSSFVQTSSSKAFSEQRIESSPIPAFQPVKFEAPPKSKIIYVAEAHASHKTNIPSEVVSKRSDFFESQEESHVVTESTLLPSEAKKIWPTGLPVQPEPVKQKKEIKLEIQPARSVPLPQEFDFSLEPGPPPEIGFATPSPKERRTSYVEQIEHDLEKDLEKEPTRHLVGAVRTMPPPKREASVESQKSLHRSNSITEETTSRPMKTHKFSTIPRPSKFNKKNFESDYESDFEGTKIKARWTPWDSDTEEPSYRKVKPPSASAQPQRPHSAQPNLGPPTFLPQEVSQTEGKRTPQESGYMADTEDSHRIFKKSHHSRSEKFIQSKQERYNQKQEKKVEKKESIDKLEPFPYSAGVQTSAKATSVPLPASPSKFVRGEFKESDYESDHESRLKTVWRSGEGVGFRPVHPPQLQDTVRLEHVLRPQPQDQVLRPQPIDLKPGSPPKMGYAPPYGVETSNTMQYAESTGSTKKFVTMKQTTRVIGFEGKKTERQTSLPSKFIPKGEAKWSSLCETSGEAKRIQRVEEMKQRFGDRSSQSVVELQPGEPPQFDYAPPIVPPATARLASKHMTDMSSSFKTKAQQFVSQVAQDVKQNGRPILKQSEPEVYREETRASEHGTKEIDPDTGLIYFKYDFGYEFGVVVPGEKGWRASSKKEGVGVDYGRPFPVIHESSTKRPVAGTTVKTVKWDSESEGTDTEGLRVRIPALSPSTASPSLSPYHPGHHTSGTSHWTSGGSSLTSSPVVVHSMASSHQPLRPPMFTTPLKDIAVVSGSSARFECIVEGSPLPSVVWRRTDGATLGSDVHQHFRNGFCRLDIPTAYQYHGGRYICIANNTAGHSETSATLTVTGEGRTYISS